jgi:hypothetical protein
MKILRAIANILLSVLLFICLTAMGAAVTASATALNPHFITSQVDKLDMAGIFNEKAVPELQKTGELAQHPEVIASLQSAVEKSSPALKSAVDKAVSDVYAYLIHGQALDLKTTLRSSLMDPALAASIIDQVDFSPYISQVLVDNLPNLNIGGIALDPTPYLPAADAVIQPYFKAQVALLLPRIYDYILGDSRTLDLSVPVGPVLDDIHSTLKTAVLASPPADFAGLPPDLLSLGFDIAWQITLPQVPASVDIISETGISLPTAITSQLDDAQRILKDVRQGVIYYQEAFWGLVALTLFFMALIAVVNFNLKRAYLVLGITFAAYGTLEAGGLIVARALIHSRLTSFSDVPISMRPWLIQLVDTATNPLLIFAVCFAAAGIILITVSALYRRRTKHPAAG